jgi:hypothetical protein
MSGMTTGNSELLIRQELWSTSLKEIFEDELQAQGWVDWLTEFPDGETFTIPSIGQATAQTVQEDQAVKYSALDTGEFQFSITEYVGSAHYVTKKNLQDSYFMNEVLSRFTEREARAIGEVLETDILKTPGPNASQAGTRQTASNANRINGADHRFVGSGTSNIIAVEDFAYAKFALKKAHVPLTNLIAIVDPESAYHLETETGLADLTYNPRWEGIIETGLTSGMRYIRNIYGFDVYESNYLDVVGAETITGGPESSAQTSSATAVQNLMFAAVPGMLPIVGAWRQMPEVDAEYNKDFQREEYVTTARWGTKLKYPENMVCVITDPVL